MVTTDGTQPVRMIFALPAILLLLAASNATYAAAGKSCPPEALASVDLAIAGATLVPVTLKGQPAWMVLQTEAAVTLIRQDAAGTLQLPVRTLSKQDGFQFTLGGRRVTQMTSFEPLLIGDLRISRTDWFIDPFPHPSVVYEGRPVAGSLAMDLLWPFDFELDLGHKKLTFYSPSSCGGRAVYWTSHFGRIPMDLTAVGDIYFTVEIDGKKLEASIGTSVESSQLSVDVARLLSAPNQPGESLTKIVKLAGGDLVIPDKIQLTSAPRGCELTSAGRADGALGYDGCYGRYPLVLGRSALQKLRLYFATKEKVIYFSVGDVE